MSNPPPRSLIAAQVSLSIVGGIVCGILIGVVGTAIFNATYTPSSPYSYPMPTYTTDPDPYVFQPPEGDYSDLAVGEPGSPVAVSPTVCPDACFDESSVEQMILADVQFNAQLLGSHKHTWNMTGNRSTADLVQAVNVDEWTRANIGPDPCFVTWAEEPIVEFSGLAVDDGLVAPMSEHSSDTNYITMLQQSVRLLPDTATAESYMATLSSGVDACTGYTGARADVVTPEPGIHPADTVAAVGFVREVVPGDRLYVFDIQRGNIVIRTVARSQGDFDDTNFRVLMQKQAQAVADAVTLPD